MNGHRLLLLGYGNTLRSDDGVGPRVVQAVEAMQWPEVQTVVAHQLAPEHAEVVSRADAVIFVDAEMDAAGEVRLCALKPRDGPEIMAHAPDPRTVLALARDIFGQVPPAWRLTIPAVNFDFGEELSEVAWRGATTALKNLAWCCASRY